MHVGDDLPREWLLPSAPTGDDALRLGWLSDEVLEDVLFEARLAAGYSKRRLIRFHDTIQTNKRIIRLAADGHTSAGIVELMGTTEGMIRSRSRRQRIHRLLECLLPGDVFVEYDRAGGNQQRAWEIQSTHPSGKRLVQV